MPNRRGPNHWSIMENMRFQKRYRLSNSRNFCCGIHARVPMHVEVVSVRLASQWATKRSQEFITNAVRRVIIPSTNDSPISADQSKTAKSWKRDGLSPIIMPQRAFGRRTEAVGTAERSTRERLISKRTLAANQQLTIAPPYVLSHPPRSGSRTLLFLLQRSRREARRSVRKQ